MSEMPRVYADFQNADPQGRLRLIGRGTMEDLERQNIRLEKGVKLRLYMEDIETVGEVVFSDHENVWVAQIDWDKIDGVNGEERN